MVRDKVGRVCKNVIQLLTLTNVTQLMQLGWEFVCIFFLECEQKPEATCKANKFDTDTVQAIKGSK